MSRIHAFKDFANTNYLGSFAKEHINKHVCTITPINHQIKRATDGILNFILPTSLLATSLPEDQYNISPKIGNNFWSTERHQFQSFKYRDFPKPSVLCLQSSYYLFSPQNDFASCSLPSIYLRGETCRGPIKRPFLKQNAILFSLFKIKYPFVKVRLIVSNLFFCVHRIFSMSNLERVFRYSS